jgi:hypothetical protein
MRTHLVYKSKRKNKHGQSMCKHNKECYRCKKCKGGSICGHNERRYICRFCSPLGWAKRILRDHKLDAIAGGYLQPKISPQEIVDLRSRASQCVLCEQPLVDGPPVLHHNHSTGIVIGFAHRRCNTVEGFIENLSREARVAFIKNVLGQL